MPFERSMHWVLSYSRESTRTLKHYDDYQGCSEGMHQEQNGLSESLTLESHVQDYANGGGSTDPGASEERARSERSAKLRSRWSMHDGPRRRSCWAYTISERRCCRRPGVPSKRMHCRSRGRGSQ